MLLVILVRGFDLSIEGIIPLTGVLIGAFFHFRMNLWVGILIIFGIASLVGVANGTLVSFVKIIPLIVTIGTGTSHQEEMRPPPYRQVIPIFWDKEKAVLSLRG